MIEAITEHHVTLGTDDKHTANLANMIHNMGAWLSEGLITKEIYIHIHNILRDNLDTENFLAVVGYRDEREKKNEYAIRVIEFPMKADGTINQVAFNEEEQAFYLLLEDSNNTNQKESK